MGDVFRESSPRMRENINMYGRGNISQSDGNFSGITQWLERSIKKYPPFNMKLRDPHNSNLGAIAGPTFSGLAKESPKLFFSQFEKYANHLQIRYNFAVVF